ncbi:MULTISPECIES: type II toxin-antitoxin system RelB/DinJ family antitoxin [Lactobacillus]|uniref:type II toxin-antitoxin system RelB/DinJ family antitoxin n=1 Tax=Lactobacillus TaxID=1578 RepID=UPI0018F05355|nr:MULTISPECIES: type II toxin-antitoxin system RelB/DinJ family antitoxin [Lactobacillus]MBI0111036.1 type II toxin-antitoxin system RelB/DinJ family antitoxin [Lactobacillus sp. W8093]WLT00256.1 type II toxin-antitoxin system RelB/DinJ family antitoxin [Lactobacillus helsingborgensis]
MLSPEKSKISISVKVNSEDKNRVTEIFNGLGLNLSTAINIFIKKSIAEGGLPFEVRDPFYSEENQAELNQRFKKINNNQDIHSHHLLSSEQKKE